MTDDDGLARTKHGIWDKRTGAGAFLWTMAVLDDYAKEPSPESANFLDQLREFVERRPQIPPDEAAMIVAAVEGTAPLRDDAPDDVRLAVAIVKANVAMQAKEAAQVRQTVVQTGNLGTFHTWLAFFAGVAIATAFFVASLALGAGT